MPQELRVVRCFQCLKYQVDIVKKANKWMCKVCGVKQSLAREFFRGSGADCRSIVHQLSLRNIATDKQESEIAELVLQNQIQLPKPTTEQVIPVARSEEANTGVKPSKWETFLAKEENNDELSIQDSLSSVSNTHFDRERIPSNGSKRKWNTVESYQPNQFDDTAGNTINKWEEYPANNLFCPHPKADRQHSRYSKVTKKNDQSYENSSETLLNYHRQNYSNKSTKQQSYNAEFPTAANTISNPSSSIVRPSAETHTPSRLCSTKKRTMEKSSIPLMNFGKRVANDSTVMVSADNQPSPKVHSSVNRSKAILQSDSKPNNTTSKWAQFLHEDNEENEGGNDDFVIF